MEKVKELTQTFLEDSPEEPERKEEDMDRLKPAINNLCHMYLPDDLTLKEVDILAMVISDIIWDPYKYIRKSKNVK